MSFYDPIRSPPRHWSLAGERALVGRGSAKRGGTVRGRRSAVSAAELRLVVLLGLFLGLVYEGIPDPGTWRGADRQAVGPAASADFTLCHSGGGWNCVVDGDTFYHEGVKIRVADIDTPETHPPRCAAEARLGEAATMRLRALLDAGPFTLATIDREEDRHGRKLRVVMRDGGSLGDALVAEGLARPYAGGRRGSWCDA